MGGSKNERRDQVILEGGRGQRNIFLPQGQGVTPPYSGWPHVVRVRRRNLVPTTHQHFGMADPGWYNW